MRQILALSFLLFILSCSDAGRESWVENAVETAAFQYHEMARLALEREAYPRSVEENGTVHWVKSHDWTSGFFPGSLFLLYDLTGDSLFAREGQVLSAGLKVMQYDSTTHDLGFILYTSLGRAQAFQGSSEVASVLHNGAMSLASRYSERVGCIRSWDFGSWQFPVIIDNMMNLEYLFWAGKTFHDSRLTHIAAQHALTTLQHHFREDYSCFHLVNYDSLTGEVLSRETFQGHDDQSAWSRGQGWALYGFTMAYRETGDQRFLNQAIHVADWLLMHPKMPEDGIPYWDLDDPEIPDVPRDASAAAVMATGMLELSRYVPKGEQYFQAGRRILQNLSSESYLAEKNTNNFFILKHSTGNLPHQSEIDVPLNYADYYYLEALQRYIDLRETRPETAP